MNAAERILAIVAVSLEAPLLHHYTPRQRDDSLPPRDAGFVERADIESALAVIAEYESETGHGLSNGQRRDLVCDNFPSWPWPYVAAVIEAIHAPWFAAGQAKP